MRNKVRHHSRSAGITLQEILVLIVIVLGLASISFPVVSRLRESARQTRCQHNLKQLTTALHSYHDAHRSLPPAAIWSTDATTSLLLHESRQVDVISMQNWVQLILPYVGQEQLAQQFHPDKPIGDPANQAARNTSVSLMTCPVDQFHRDDNYYSLQTGNPDQPPLRFARGNYGINGGTHNFQTGTPSTAWPIGEGAKSQVDYETRSYQLEGNGIAGMNKAFRFNEFTNGTGTLVALEELRAGIHPNDPRGVWSLGQIGGSITWGHGVGGDNYAPNHSWVRADDILGCKSLHDILGTEQLMRHGMPCVDYIDRNQQATSRSQHPGGVYVSFLDGSVRFLSNEINPGLWHVMHSRETPPAVFESRQTQESTVATTSQNEKTEPSTHLSPFSNSIGMKFVVIPAGQFHMGIADFGNGPTPENVPAHPVTIPKSFWMGQCEVTIEQFAQLMEPRSDAMIEPVESSKLPVTGITWEQANAFCKKLTEREYALGHKRSYRLPTEAEWEYCSREGSRLPYRWYANRQHGDVSGDAAGISPALPILPVGSYPANKFGLHDMRGNAWEWTADWFERDYYTRSPELNPQGPAVGYIKVVRGSDWRFVGEPCHIDYPMLPPWKSNPVVGFRVVCEEE